MGYHILTEDGKKLSAETGEHLVTSLPTAIGNRLYRMTGMKALSRRLVKRPSVKRSRARRRR